MTTSTQVPQVPQAPHAPVVFKMYMKYNMHFPVPQTVQEVKYLLSPHPLSNETIRQASLQGLPKASSSKELAHRAGRQAWSSLEFLQGTGLGEPRPVPPHLL